MQKIIPKGKQGVGTIIVVLIVAVVLALGVAGYAVMNSQEADKEQIQKDLSIGNCGDNEPYIDLVAEDPYSGGSVTVGLHGLLNPVESDGVISGDYIGAVTSGTTKFALNDKVALLLSAANYINKTIIVDVAKCGSNKVAVPIYATDAGTLDIMDDSYVKVTDAVNGAVNITSAAGSINVKVKVTGTSDQSSGKLLITMESNDTQVKDFSVSGVKILDADFGDALSYTLFAAEGTSPTIKMAFTVDELLDAETRTYDVLLNPETGRTIGESTETAPIYVNVYSGQACIDIVGNSNVFRETCWEDTRGTSKYEDIWADADALIE